MSITRSIRSSLFSLVLLAMSAAAYAQFSIAVSFAPPELPVYEQPMAPGRGLHLDAWLLGILRRRLLLGAGNMGHGSATWSALDARLLGLGR